MIIRPVPLYTMLVVEILKENLQKAFHRIIAPAEKYTIFKNKSKRKLTMDNTTMLDLLLQGTLVVSETGFLTSWVRATKRASHSDIPACEHDGDIHLGVKFGRILLMPI